MKSSFHFLSSGLIALLICLSTILKAQDLNKEKLRSLLETKHFVFEPQSVNPQSGPTRQLTSSFDLKLKGDTMISYLPYFGRAYAPIRPEEGGINFTSTSFEYSLKEKRKNRWELQIRPKDVNDIRLLSFTIFENGSATLQVTSNNRQLISYQGKVGEY
jgi:hypothetical protein